MRDTDKKDGFRVYVDVLKSGLKGESLQEDVRIVQVAMSNLLQELEESHELRIAKIDIARYDGKMYLDFSLSRKFKQRRVLVK